MTPNDDSSVWSKRWWSIVSNAALRSSRTSIAPPWVSTARRRSFWTRRRAVSVLCSWRYADWKTSYRWWAFRWSTSCTYTMRSTSLDKKERFETGRKFFKISQSSMASFRSGKTKALFNPGEKSANSREVLTTSVSTGVSSSRQSLRMDVGIGSREHDLLEDDIIFRTTSWLTMRNLSRGTPSKSLTTLSKNPQDLGGSILSCRRSSWQIDWPIQSHSYEMVIHFHLSGSIDYYKLWKVLWWKLLILSYL